MDCLDDENLAVELLFGFEQEYATITSGCSTVYIHVRIRF
jgi:hypothetical protein